MVQVETNPQNYRDGVDPRHLFTHFIPQVSVNFRMPGSVLGPGAQSIREFAGWKRKQLYIWTNLCTRDRGQGGGDAGKMSSTSKG